MSVVVRGTASVLVEAIPALFPALVLTLVLSLCAFAPVRAQTNASALGRAVFETGKGRDGREIIGRVAGGTVSLRGAAVACTACHGARGTGGSEAWIAAPDIRWFALSKPYGARRSGDESRPPYDRASFARALRAGTAPDGVALDPAMPRFDLADDEIDALMSHLVHLSDGPQREDVRPGLVLLLPQSTSTTAERLREGLQSCPTIATDGTVPRNLPALRVMRYTSVGAIEPVLVAATRDGSAAALFAPYLVGAEADYMRATFRTELPALLPMTMHDLGDARILFEMPDLAAQARALIRSEPAGAGGELAVVFENEMPGREALRMSVTEAAAQARWRVRIAEDAAAAAADPEVSALLVLGPMPAPPERPRPGFRLWAPVAYVEPQRLQAWSARGAAIRVALPYRPSLDGDDSRLIPPVDAWVAVGCELIARLPPLPERASGVAAWRASLRAQPELRLGEWLRLPASTSVDEAAARVHVMAWPPR